MTRRPALFLDRDGVLIEELHYTASIERMRIIDGAVEAIRGANREGIPVVVVTNQSGVARGHFSEKHVQEFHTHLDRTLTAQGACVRRFYYCPHHPDEGAEAYRVRCPCRKPQPGMLLEAGRDLGIDLERSWMIGDRLSDLQAGAQAGCRTVLVRTGYGAQASTLLPAQGLNLVGIADDVRQAAQWFFATPSTCRGAKPKEPRPSGSG